MDSDRAQAIDQAVIDALSSRSADDAIADDDLVDKRSGLRRVDYLDILESQYQARHLDLEARRLRSRGTGFYTIGSAGHEGNAVVAAALRPTDPAFLHYRSGGFFAHRSKQISGTTPVFDVLLSLCASSEDPIAGGRHKVFGSTALWMPPQTSTIASHVPKAMGTAFAMERSKRLGQPLPFPEDSIVVCTFGDGALNHASALAGMNAGAWASYQNLPMPILFVCEDNGVGISVQTPPGWVERVWRSYPRIAYLRADGCDIIDTYRQARAAVDLCRRRRTPVFLHLELVRLLGHAGADVELTYHSREQIHAAEARDPVLGNSVRAVELGHGSRGLSTSVIPRNRRSGPGGGAGSRTAASPVERRRGSRHHRHPPAAAGHARSRARRPHDDAHRAVRIRTAAPGMSGTTAPEPAPELGVARPDGQVSADDSLR